jgi:CO dehydrogenase maturation factor
MIVVAEPGKRSLGTAGQIAKLAHDIGIRDLYLVGNKMRNEDDIAFLRAHSPGLPVLGTLPVTPAAIEADLSGVPAYDAAPQLRDAAYEIVAELDRLFDKE